LIDVHLNTALCAGISRNIIIAKIKQNTDVRVMRFRTLTRAD